MEQLRDIIRSVIKEEGVGKARTIEIDGEIYTTASIDSEEAAVEKFIFKFIKSWNNTKFAEFLPSNHVKIPTPSYTYEGVISRYAMWPTKQDFENTKMIYQWLEDGLSFMHPFVNGIIGAKQLKSFFDAIKDNYSIMPGLPYYGVKVRMDEGFSIESENNEDVKALAKRGFTLFNIKDGTFITPSHRSFKFTNSSWGN